MDKTQYFAALPSEELALELTSRVETFSNEIESTLIKAKWQKSYRHYHNMPLFGQRVPGANSDIRAGGSQGELSEISINDYRNLLQHLLVLTTSNRPAFDVRATNSDSKSLSQARLGNKILDYYLREKRLEQLLFTAVEQALVFGRGFVKVEWDVTSGKEYGVNQETQQVKMDGDLKFSNPSVFDVVFDTTKASFEDNQWLIVRSFKNKYDLIASYPEIAEELANLPSRTEENRPESLHSGIQTDDIEVFEFFHRKTQAMPKGRYVFFTHDGIVMQDAELPYRDLPIYSIAPAPILGTQYGYTPAFDLSGLQEAQDILYSTALTNIMAFGVQNVLVPKGSDLNIQSLSGGLNVVEYENGEQGKPEALNLTSTPAEVYKFMEIIEKKMETLSGVNSVARGNPESSLKSGTALALVQSMSVQFASGLQNSYARLIEDVGTGALRILRDYASTDRVISVAGKHSRADLVNFNGDDLENINRVVVDVANSLTKTTAGKVELATNLLNTGLIKNAQEYITVMTTGQLEPLIEHETTQLHLIRHENEALMEGQPVVAIAVDDHETHIKEHSCVLADPELRMTGDPAIIQNTLAHIQEHINHMASVDPALLNILGYQSLQMPPGPPMDPNAPSAPAPTPGGGQATNKVMAPPSEPKQASPAKPAQPPAIPVG